MKHYPDKNHQNVRILWETEHTIVSNWSTAGIYKQISCFLAYYSLCLILLEAPPWQMSFHLGGVCRKASCSFLKRFVTVLFWISRHRHSIICYNMKDLQLLLALIQICLYSVFHIYMSWAFSLHCHWLKCKVLFHRNMLKWIYPWLELKAWLTYAAGVSRLSSQHAQFTKLLNRLLDLLWTWYWRATVSLMSGDSPRTA